MRKQHVENPVAFLEYDWFDFERMIKDAVDILKQVPIDAVYGVPRGGLPIAVRLSYLLNVPLVEDIRQNTLVVDDISDTGKTLKELVSRHNCRTFTWHMRLGSSHSPYLSMESAEPGVEIVYPWENDYR